MGRNTETRAAVVTNVVEQNRNERNRRKKKTKTKTRKKGLSTFVPPSPMACAIQALNRSACGPHDPGYNYGDGICGLRATCFLLLGPAGQKNKCLIPALEDLQRACDSNFDHFLDVSSLGKKYRDPEERGTRETKKTRAKNNLDAHVLRQTQNWLLGRDGNGMAWHIGNHHDDIALAKTWFDREAVYYDDTAQEVLMNYRLLIKKVMPFKNRFLGQGVWLAWKMCAYTTSDIALQVLWLIAEYQSMRCRRYLVIHLW